MSQGQVDAIIRLVYTACATCRWESSTDWRFVSSCATCTCSTEIKGSKWRFPIGSSFILLQGQVWTVRTRRRWKIALVCPRDLTHEFKQVWIRASGRGEKIWSPRQRFLVIFSMSHEGNFTFGTPFSERFLKRGAFTLLPFCCVIIFMHDRCLQWSKNSC